MLILLLFVVQAGSENPYRNNAIACDGLIFHDVFYDREVLFENLGKPYNVVVHPLSDKVFFSHTVQNGDFVDFKISTCDINSRICNDLNVNGGYAIAHDKENDEIYLGGHDGIYQYNIKDNNVQLFAGKGKSIWGIFVKNNFYYIQYPKQSLHVYRNGGFVQVAEAIGMEIDNFFISKQNHIYFSNKTALYKLERNIREVIHLDDELNVRQIVEDYYGDVYFVAPDGIYKEEKPYRKVEKIAAIDQAYGLAFDENERVIYSDKDAIYSLNPSENSELCYAAVTKSLNEKVTLTTRKPVDIMEFAEELMRRGYY